MELRTITIHLPLYRHDAMAVLSRNFNRVITGYLNSVSYWAYFFRYATIRNRPPRIRTDKNLNTKNLTTAADYMTYSAYAYNHIRNPITGEPFTPRIRSVSIESAAKFLDDYYLSFTMGKYIASLIRHGASAEDLRRVFSSYKKHKKDMPDDLIDAVLSRGDSAIYQWLRKDIGVPPKKIDMALRSVNAANKSLPMVLADPGMKSALNRGELLTHIVREDLIDLFDNDIMHLRADGKATERVKAVRRFITHARDPEVTMKYIKKWNLLGSDASALETLTYVLANIYNIAIWNRGNLATDPRGKELALLLLKSMPPIKGKYSSVIFNLVIGRIEQGDIYDNATPIDLKILSELKKFIRNNRLG